jgi:hypothetical protein
MQGRARTRALVGRAVAPAGSVISTDMVVLGTNTSKVTQSSAMRLARDQIGTSTPIIDYQP